jgi:molecular chaperone IbpA
MKDLVTLGSNFNQLFVGFDNMFKQIEKSADLLNSTTYPPYNIFKDQNDEYVIELAVSGFTKDNLDVELANNVLTIKGKSEQEESDSNYYFFRSLAKRNFERKFKFHEYLEVEDVTLNNGILKITTKQNIPEEKKPKKFTIN